MTDPTRLNAPPRATARTCFWSALVAGWGSGAVTVGTVGALISSAPGAADRGARPTLRGSGGCGPGCVSLRSRRTHRGAGLAGALLAEQDPGAVERDDGAPLVGGNAEPAESGIGLGRRVLQRELIRLFAQHPVPEMEELEQVEAERDAGRAVRPVPDP